MKKILLLAFGAMIVASSYGQRKEERQLSDFNEVSVTNAINLYLKQGNETKAVVEIDGVELERVLTEVSGGKLKISLKKSNSDRSKHVKVYVTYKSLEYISANSAADVYSESVIKADKLKISASSAASMELDIDVKDLNMSASSAGDIELSGKAESITGSASSAGDVDAFDLVCKTADVKASSGGGVKINVTDEIEARASSGGSVKYKGNPSRSNTDSSSGGSVRKY